MNKQSGNLDMLINYVEQDGNLAMLMEYLGVETSTNESDLWDIEF